MTEETKCGKCGLSIHPSESGIRYFGFFTAHSEGRCAELLRLEITRLRAALDAQGEALKVAEEALRELLTAGDNPDLTFQVNRMRFDLAICQARDALAALAAAKEGA